MGTTEADDNRALLILAGAGTGKTNTLAHRVVHLILNGVDPRRILLMTFSRRAAETVAESLELAATPDKVWLLIGQFNLDWHPLVARVSLTGTGTGQLRRIETRDGRGNRRTSRGNR
jgi:hypothetical protein